MRKIVCPRNSVSYIYAGSACIIIEETGKYCLNFPVSFVISGNCLLKDAGRQAALKVRLNGRMISVFWKKVWTGFWARKKINKIISGYMQESIFLDEKFRIMKI